MPEIFNREQIEGALQRIDVTAAMEEGFIAYSEGKVVVPPVGELVFDDPPGDVHIKYGYRVRGEICHALTAGVLQDRDVLELGKVIVDPALPRTADSQITVADLTGVAVQDIQISKAVYQILKSGPPSG